MNSGSSARLLGVASACAALGLGLAACTPPSHVDSTAPATPLNTTSAAPSSSAGSSSTSSSTASSSESTSAASAGKICNFSNGEINLDRASSLSCEDALEYVETYLSVRYTEGGGNSLVAPVGDNWICNTPTAAIAATENLAVSCTNSETEENFGVYNATF